MDSANSVGPKVEGSSEGRVTVLSSNIGIPYTAVLNVKVAFKHSRYGLESKI